MKRRTGPIGRRTEASTAAERVSIDDVDRTIIRILQQDGRASYTDISREVALTGPAVRARIQRLTDTGAMRIVGITNPELLGMPAAAMLGIHVSKPAVEVANAISQHPNVMYIVHVAGGYDLLVEIICPSLEALATLVDTEIRSVAGVSRLEIFPYFLIHTERYGFEHPVD
jgi:Lrp/AsnC family transcriptional regulator for asnA, asnC and gidA